MNCFIDLMIFLLGLSFIQNANSLKDVRLELIPEKIQQGGNVQLKCYYDLEGAALYSVKYYRGYHEFYRYVPTEEPSTKIFNFTWITVDPLNTHDSQVTIKNVDYPMSGNFSCEVTTDAPDFTVATNSKMLKVVPKFENASNQSHKISLGIANLMMVILIVMQLY